MLVLPNLTMDILKETATKNWVTKRIGSLLTNNSLEEH